MRVLVACEFSGRVRDAFLARGHEAYSCDFLANSHPNHIRGDVTPLLREKWDLVIAHPPCTYLCNSGVRWLSRGVERRLQVLDGVKFFKTCLAANADRVCVENPIPHGLALRLIGVRYTQVIQPHQFGEPETKATCLWLKGLTPLQPTLVLEKPACGHWRNQTQTGQNALVGTKHANYARAVTYRGIALAMAEQWGS